METRLQEVATERAEGGLPVRRRERLRKRRHGLQVRLTKIKALCPELVYHEQADSASEVKNGATQPVNSEAASDDMVSISQGALSRAGDNFNSKFQTFSYQVELNDDANIQYYMCSLCSALYGCILNMDTIPTSFNIWMEKAALFDAH